MDFQKNSNQIDVMDSPIIAAQKSHNQNIAEKPLIDKMEKEFLDINQQIERIAQAVEAGTISIEEEQKAYERIEEEIARLRAEQDGLKKRVKENERAMKETDEKTKENERTMKENDKRLLTLESAAVTMMETEDETKALFNNVKSFLDRLTKIEEKQESHTQSIANLRKYIVQSSERQQEDNGKNFMYLYILFGLTIAAVAGAIVIRLIRG